MNRIFLGLAILFSTSFLQAQATDDNEIKIDQILDCLRSQGLEIMDLSTEEADLADVFRLLTKNS